jgi:hypothetical protein
MESKTLLKLIVDAKNENIKLYRKNKLIGATNGDTKTYYGSHDNGKSKHFSSHFNRMGLELNELAVLNLYNIVQIEIGIKDLSGYRIFSTTLENLFDYGGVYPLGKNSIYVMMDNIHWNIVDCGEEHD